MNFALFDYPKNSFFGKSIPKAKFYEYGTVSNKLKDLFVKQVEQITWLYKLAPETINVQATKDVQEIQIFGIRLKGEDLSDEVLLSIDKAVKYPIIFEIQSSVSTRVVAAYKAKLANQGPEFWKIGHYMKSMEYDLLAARKKLSIGLNLDSIYEQIICSLSSVKKRQDESLRQFVDRDYLIGTKNQQINSLLKKIKLEKQFNKKVELNSKLNLIQKELSLLIN